MNKDVCKEENYRKLYHEHANHLRNFMYYKCGDLAQAEDLMQEAFIKLWENCKKVIFEKTKSFLFTIANRLFLNKVEHDKVKLNFEKSVTKEQSGDDPEFILREKEFKEQLENAIGSLPEGQREVFLMHRIDQMTYQEIADLQGVSIKAIHKRMYKAMAKLKDTIKELNDYKI